MRLADRPDLEGVDPAGLPHGSHGVRAGELLDIADDFAVIALHEEADGLVRALGLATVEGQRVRIVRDRLPVHVGEMPLLDREVHN